MLSYAAGLAAAAAAAAGIAGLPHGTGHQLRLVAVHADADATCATPPGSTPPAGNLVVAVPQPTMIRVDANDNPTSVMTNTGERPCAGDEFYVITAGAARRAPATLVARVLALHFAGDWHRSGVWHVVTADD